MLVGIFTPFDKDWAHHEALIAFAEGIPEPDRFVARVEVYQPCDVAVVFGVEKKAVPYSKHRGGIIQQQLRQGRRLIVLETGYVRREQYYAAGWGAWYPDKQTGLNGRAWFHNHMMPDDRWKALGVELKPWRTNGQHIVLCGQIPWDASVQHSDHLAWVRATADEILRRWDRPLIFRPHPLYSGDYPLPDSPQITISRGGW